MKNSPEEEWLHSLEKRLRDYTEEPDAGLWNKISEKVNNDRKSIWIPWSNRAAAVIALVALIWLWSIHHNDVSNPARKTPGEKEYLPGKNDGEDQSIPGNDNKSVQQGFLQPEKNTTVIKADNSNVVPENKEAILTANNDHHELVDTEVRKETLSLSLQSISERINGEHETITPDTIKPLLLKDEHETVPDSIKPLLVKDDNSERPLELKEKKKPVKKKRHLTLYSTITPLLTYHKVTPFKNDGIVINRFNERPILSRGRLGANMEVGVQGRLSEKLEFFGGLSVYKQSQTLTYQYQAGDNVSVQQQADFSYMVTPENIEKNSNYDMLTVGGQAGILYLIRGERLMHKLGAGLSYQHGILRSEEGSYMNDQSKYVFYQIFYRNEYVINKTVRIFVQPFYTHALFSKEKLDEPFKLTPYRAGIGFGVIYQFH